MKKSLMMFPLAALLLLGVCQSGELSAKDKAAKKESAVKQEIKSHFKLYGFIRNFFAFDSRESTAGTGDLFYYLPKDEKLNAVGDDLNAVPSFRFLALTSRVGLDVTGYQIGRTKFGAKVEADFYAGLTSSSTNAAFPNQSKVNGTAQLRLRQAYVTVGWDDLNACGKDDNASVFLKIGQAWHPMAADQPHVFSLETGAPFNAFSRTPMVMMDASIGKNFMVTAGALWQMQYLSQGPEGASADYIKYGCTPEGYVGLTVKSNNGFLARAGVDILSIKPRRLGTAVVDDPEHPGTKVSATVKVKDRITTVSPYIYLQYKKGSFEAKAKTIFSQGGEHMNLMSGYGISRNDFDDGHYEYTPFQTSSTWASLSYGKKWQVMLMGGYVKNLGTKTEMVNADGKVLTDNFYFSANGSKSLNSMWRVIPAVVYNIGKFSLGLEYNVTAARYGDGKSYNIYGLSLDGLHWVYNHRVQMMVKFTF
ncbi:MAG: hypothetical protein ACI395_04385 [Candidatus Cryptobacteroides sp.]